VDEKSFYAAVAERAGLSKEEAADLTRATLAAIAGQISSGEVQKLAQALPDWLGDNLPQHDGSAHPVALTDAVRQISRRTGLTQEETHRGVGAVLTVMRETVDRTHLEQALFQLPKDYRQLEAT
jgi:uncharacterized protein (DUF2267 family)